MKRRALKKIGLVLQVLVFGYLGVLMFWFLLFWGCLIEAENRNYNEGVCSQDLMSQTIKITHKPLIEFLLK
jgi:hypothetical protein